METLGLGDEGERTRVGVALEEALANALYHGNLQVGSELRGEDDEAYYRLIQERMRTPLLQSSNPRASRGCLERGRSLSFVMRVRGLIPVRYRIPPILKIWRKQVAADFF